MNEEEFRQIAQEELSKQIMENLNSGIIFKYINTLEERNKDLEQIEKEHKEENGRLREELKNIEYIKRNFDYCLEQKIKEGIELKVKEKIEEYNKMIDATFEEKTCFADNRRNTCMEIIQILQEL